MDVEVREGTDEVEFAVSGRIDSVTAPDLESRLADYVESGRDLVLDLSNTHYVSSAGLRVFLSTHKALQASSSSLVIANPNDIILEVLKVTGLISVMDVVVDGHAAQ